MGHADRFTPDQLQPKEDFAEALVAHPGGGEPSTLTFGRQLDVRAVRGSALRSPAAVAGYLAKYATKAAESVTGTLERIRDPRDLPADLDPHAARLIRAAWELGGRRSPVGARPRRWAHQLGFGGHFSTRSRRYSTTMGALRAERHAWRQQRGPMHQPVVTQWVYVGQGHDGPAERVLVATAAVGRSEARRAARDARDVDRARAAAVW